MMHIRAVVGLREIDCMCDGRTSHGGESVKIFGGSEKTRPSKRPSFRNVVIKRLTHTRYNKISSL